MNNKNSNFHEELRNELLRDAEFAEEYNSFSLKLQLAEELKIARTKKNMSLDEVASKMETSSSALSRFEAAGKTNPTLATIVKYLEAINCHLEFRVIENGKKKKSAWVSATA
ncbi:MAG TPA: helix-turn-helix transcriptional regulator [Burkholderiales bacterium]|nr:helix-turn-helix transcriptional regulator [Burkholderiales bacterium]